MLVGQRQSINLYIVSPTSLVKYKAHSRKVLLRAATTRSAGEVRSGQVEAGSRVLTLHHLSPWRNRSAAGLDIELILGLDLEF